MCSNFRKINWYPSNYQKGDEFAIISLMQKDIEKRKSKAVYNEAYWRWKYESNIAGFYPNWIKLAKFKDNDIIGGHYTAIPIILRKKNDRILSAQSVDTMTSASLRKQGVFTSLAEICYEELIKNKADIIYGFPNENSFPGFINKLHWKHIFTVLEFAYILKIKELVNYKIKNKYKAFFVQFGFYIYNKIMQILTSLRLNKNIRFESVYIEDINTTLLNDIIAQNNIYFSERSTEYLKWRYDFNPIDKEWIAKRVIVNSKTAGYYILKIKDYPHRDNIKITHIMEIILDQSVKKIYPTVFKDIIDLSKNAGATLIYAFSHKNQYDYKEFLKFGFAKVDSKNFIIKVLGDTDKYPGIYKPKNWFITQGDSDRA